MFRRLHASSPRTSKQWSAVDVPPVEGEVHAALTSGRARFVLSRSTELRAERSTPLLAHPTPVVGLHLHERSPSVALAQDWPSRAVRIGPKHDVDDAPRSRRAVLRRGPSKDLDALDGAHRNRVEVHARRATTNRAFTCTIAVVGDACR